MADEDEDDKSEEASPRRLDQAWEQGDIALSRDVIGWAGLAGFCAVLIMTAGSWRSVLLAATVHTFGTLDRMPFPDFQASAAQAVQLALAAIGTGAICSLAAALAQTRAGFWPERAMPDPSRLFQASRLTHPFTKEGVTDLAFALGKMIALMAVFTYAARAQLSDGLELMETGTDELLTRYFAPLQSITGRVMLTLAVLAGIDFFLARRKFNKKTRMTKSEMKQDAKEENGDPLIKSRRRRRHRELARGRVMSEVPKADAIIVNPTHIAIAIRYRKAEGGAPKVIAKGKGQLAEIIRDLARANGIPIIEDIPLARLLYRRVKIGGAVPAETYKAVATILAFVYRVTGTRPSSSTS